MRQVIAERKFFIDTTLVPIFNHLITLEHAL